MLRGLLRGPAAIVLPLLIVASCGPDTAQAYYAYVENRSGEPAVVVPLADDGAVWFQDDFYRVPPDGARWWAGGGPIYSVRAAVVVYDSSCRFRGRV